MRTDCLKLASVSRFRADERGNIAIMFGLMLVPLLMFTGGAVDFSRLNAVRADLIESLDAAGLAIAQLDALNPPEFASMTDAQREAALKQYGEDFFLENFRYEPLVDDLEVDFAMTPQTITPRASGRIKTLILHAAEAAMGASTSSMEFLDLTSETEITRRGSGRIELALVLDVTGSMGDPVNGVDKIDSLRDAVDAMLDTMFGSEATSTNLKMAVVPFNAHVNPAGAESWDSSWTDTTAAAPYHGSRFFHVTQNGAVDTTIKVNHLRLHESVTGNTWKGCVEERPFPLDEVDTVPGSASTTAYINSVNTVPSALQEPDARIRLAFTRAPALTLPAATIAASASSKWVPMFRFDEPNCWDDNEYCRGDWSTVSESYIQGGSTVTTSNRGRWHHNPDDDDTYLGLDLDMADYGNSYIGDRYYTYYGNGTENAARYWRIVNTFRSTMAGGASDFKTFLNGLGATDRSKDEYVLRNSYVGWWNPTTSKYVHKYNISPTIDETITDDDSYTIGPNEDCPEEILPLTDTRADVEDKVADLFPNGNTNSAAGMMWGWRVLSPDAPFTEGVAYDDPDWQKAVVLMTDGQNTMSNYDTHWGSSPSIYGYETERRMGSGVNNADDGSSSTFSASSMRDHLDEKLLRICRRMKQEGILVYSIVFGLNDPTTEQVFKSCATSPTAPYYFKAPTGAQLESAFGQIAQDLVNLHVSR